MSNHAQAESFNEIQPIDNFCQDYKHIPPSSVRWDCHERKRNGAEEAGAFVRIGKKYMVNVPRYLDWKLANNG